MYGWLIKLVARPGQKGELLEFLRWDADVAREREPGTLRFDAWESADDPNAVYLYEGYVDKAAFDEHKQNEPFKRFMEHVVPNVIEPPVVVLPPAETDVSNASGKNRPAGA